MFKVEKPKSGFASFFVILELIYHSTVRSIQAGHRYAYVSLLQTILQSLIMLLVFYVMLTFLGMRPNAIRGDFIVYILSGIFMYFANVKALGAVAGSEGPISGMMLHAPMNTTIAIGAAALQALYTQVLSITVILGAYHLAVARVEIEDPVGAFGMLLLAWFNGVSIGMIVLACRPWAPGPAGVAQTLYTRANMFASGKMFVANTLQFTMLAMFIWNPLFHIIDQARGYAFINYNPRHTSVAFPLKVTLVLFSIGLIGEYYTRKRVSISWFMGR